MNGWIKRWAVVGLLLWTGWAYAGEPPPYAKATERVALRGWSATWEDEEANEMAFTQNLWKSTTGDVTAAASWTGGVPDINDVCVLDGSNQQSMTQNLDPGITCGQFLVKPQYHGTIGSQGDPLHLTLTTGHVVLRGRGQAFVNPTAGGFANVTVDVRHGRRTSGYDVVLGGGGFGVDGNIALLGVKRGVVNVQPDMNGTASWSVLGDAARLVIDAAGGGVVECAHIICSAGELINRRSFQASQFLVVGDRSRVTQIGALVATNYVLVIGNGRFQYLPTTAPGTSPKLIVLGGTYDQSDEKWDNVWGSTVIGPDASIKGGTVRGTNLWPPSINWQLEYPGAESN